MTNDQVNHLTFDVEDWFSTPLIKNKINDDSNVPAQLKLVLKILEKHDVKCTFFIVARLAQQHPEILDLLDEGDHEIALHGYDHGILWEKDKNQFEKEIVKSKKIIGKKTIGFRASCLSLDNRNSWIIDVLSEYGFLYDSSVLPSITPHYGVFGAPYYPYKPSSLDLHTEDSNRELWEFPLLSFGPGPLKFPLPGGFFFRNLPTSIFEMAIKSMNKRGYPATIYLHPWELDQSIKRSDIGLYPKFIMYTGLHKTQKKIEWLIKRFKFGKIEDTLIEVLL